MIKRKIHAAIADMIQDVEKRIQYYEEYAAGLEPELFNETIAGAKLKILISYREMLYELLKE